MGWDQRRLISTIPSAMRNHRARIVKTAVTAQRCVAHVSRTLYFSWHGLCTSHHPSRSRIYLFTTLPCSIGLSSSFSSTDIRHSTCRGRASPWIIPLRVPLFPVPPSSPLHQGTRTLGAISRSRASFVSPRLGLMKRLICVC